MSDTNFWAARDNNRFLRRNDEFHKREGSETLDKQANVFTFKSHTLEVVVCDLIGYLQRDS